MTLSDVVQKQWNYYNILSDGGLSCGNNVETFPAMPYLRPFSSAVQTESKPSTIGSSMHPGLKLISTQRSQLFSVT